MKHPTLKTWHKIIVIIFAFLAIILFAAPRVAKWYVVKKSPELIGRKVSIDKIRLNYFSGVLRLKDFTLFESDNEKPFLSFEEFLVNLDYLPLTHRELKISKVKLDKFFCHVDQKGKEFNFSDMLPEKDTLAKEEKQVKDSSVKSMILTFNDIHINDSRLEYSDLLLDNHIEIEDFDFRIPGFTLNSGSTELALKFDIEQGGVLSTNLVFDQIDSTYALQLKLDSFNLDIAVPYLKTAMIFNDINGYFSNDIYIRGDLHHLLQFNVKGWTRLSNLEMIDKENRKSFSLEKLYIDIDNFLFETKDIRLNEVSMEKLYALVEREDSVLNIASMIKHKRTKEERDVKKDERKKARNNAPAFLLEIKDFDLDKGEISFIDNSMDEPFEALIHDISIKSKDIKGKSSPIAVNFNAILNESGEIESFFSLKNMETKDMTLDFSLEKFAMKDIEPYMFYYFGYPVESGFLNFNTSNHFTTNHLTSDNNIYVRQFKLGDADKSEAEKKLPLKLAVGILTNKDGEIEIELPIESEGEETSIKNLGHIIGQAFGNFIGKVVASPNAALASSISSHPEKLEDIEFGLLEEVPDKDNMEVLDLVIEVLEEKPEMDVQLVYTVDSNVYQDTLARLFTEEAYMKSKRDKNQPTDEELLKFVSRKTKTKDSSVEDLDELCRQYAGPEYLSEKMADMRTRQVDYVNDYLNSNSNISRDRYKINTQTSDTILKDSSTAKFLIKFNVEDN